MVGSQLAAVMSRMEGIVAPFVHVELALGGLLYQKEVVSTHTNCCCFSYKLKKETSDVQCICKFHLQWIVQTLRCCTYLMLKLLLFVCNSNKQVMHTQVFCKLVSLHAPGKHPRLCIYT